MAEVAGEIGDVGEACNRAHRFGDLERGIVSILGLARTPAAGPAGSE